MLAIVLEARGRVKIGEDIEVWNRSDHSIRISIKAPREVPIVRDSAKVKDPK